jgi:hypothetical protein
VFIHFIIIDFELPECENNDESNIQMINEIDYNEMYEHERIIENSVINFNLNSINLDLEQLDRI